MGGYSFVASAAVVRGIYALNMSLSADYDPEDIINNASDIINDVNADDESFIPPMQYVHVQAQSQLLLVVATELLAIRKLLSKDDN